MNDEDARIASYIGGYYDAEGLYKDEIERLRGALRAIRDYDGTFAVIFDGDDALAMIDIARAALGEKE